VIAELMNIEWVVENEIEHGMPERSLAVTYAFGLRASSPPDWKRINNAILTKFGKRGLTKIKTRAWRLFEGKEQP